MSPDSEGLGAAVVAGVGSNLTQSSGISYFFLYRYPVSILYKFIAGRYPPIRVADGPITARYRFIRNDKECLSGIYICSVILVLSVPLLCYFDIT